MFLEAVGEWGEELGRENKVGMEKKWGQQQSGQSLGFPGYM